MDAFLILSQNDLQAVAAAARAYELARERGLGMRCVLS